MDLDSGYPFWAVKNGLMDPFPPLAGELRCEVLVIGAGISGALIADTLHERGHEVCVLDARDVGWGSTAASTALLQYEIDTHMVDLARRHGEAAAVLAYRSCADAIDQLAAVAARVRDVGFRRSQSLYYASTRRHRGALREEFEARAARGFAVEWLGPGDVLERYGFEAPCAILSRTGAQVDCYRLALRIFGKVEAAGVHVHDRTRVETIEPDGRGVTLRTTAGATVRARHVVLAAGYAG